MLDRRAQVHQDILVGDLQSKNLFYGSALNHLTHLFVGRGMDTAHAALEAHRIVYGQLQRQSMMLSFIDNYWLLAMLSLAVIPLMFTMKKVAPHRTRVAAH